MREPDSDSDRTQRAAATLLVRHHTSGDEQQILLELLKDPDVNPDDVLEALARHDPAFGRDLEESRKLLEKWERERRDD